MQFEGKAIRVQEIDSGFYELTFDLINEPVNKFNRLTLRELKDAVTQLSAVEGINGVLFSSAKECFIVGADITEFSSLFDQGEEGLIAALLDTHGIFNAVEDLPCPTVTAINGLALGGGFELCLSTDYRVMGNKAKVGLPEVKLGINPGWGGIVRLPRLIGIDNAHEWICSGAEKRAAAALKDGAVDAVVEQHQVREAGINLLRQCAAGKFDYAARRQIKQSPVKLNQIEQMMAFETAKGMIGAKAGPHYPAPLQAVKTIQKSCGMTRDKAILAEAQGVAKLASGPVVKALVGLFMKDQYVKKVSRGYEAKADKVNQAAVLGAGIMGGGVAYQSASKGVPILMKDINESAIQLGLDEANKLLAGQLKRGRIDAAKMATTINRIRPTLSYGDFATVDLVVEAVVENQKVKAMVLAETEQHITEDAVLASNTSTISINALAKSLKRPENFCGMHFFNPVHMMPLVEVIRGEQTSAATIARTVAYASAMGKTPIVVNDCPGFLVNRVLFPYFGGFSGLLQDGADFRQVDKVMERFGWPMGPAYLLDVVGIDTAHHADQVMAAGFPERMSHEGESVIDRMFSLERFGQKNNKGFYRYELDRKGKPAKLPDVEVDALIEGVVGTGRDVDEQEIIERMMIPLCIETVRCLEEGVVASPAEADMAMIYGIGFPPFRGGVFHYLDEMGLAAFCAMTAKYAELGPLYQPTETMRQMAAAGSTYLNNTAH
ncbi:fatty acid oxidation complex subunit alpha FadB [Amphritea sp. 1_MG-2023]|uniref:fatty acid oxidation complex subunit alpha FadB n=1 Tax=Amphritea sp. 1_MG-2023 TaxID=3062670 RepID=UPI0026E42E8F|nr:fatty acid oxidation complex subunit alpha FadB [Amphritea sp. 1_MG-2023]MDO6564907.1 fatty acid oxidation complex subunit alpha FadB [Amphritea sp. 1_MG-2023]